MATYDTTDGVLADTLLYVESISDSIPASNTGTRRNITSCVKAVVVGTFALIIVANGVYFAWIAYRNSKITH